MVLRGICAALVGASAAACLPAFAVSAADDAALRRGEVIVSIVERDGPGGQVRAAIDIPVPPATLWPLMLDCARAHEFVPGLTSCRVLETAPDGASDLREHKVRFIPVLPNLTLRFRSRFTPFREIRFSREGGDLQEMEGLWRLEPIEDGRATRLHYDVALAPKVWVPAQLIRDGLRRDAPKVLLALRAEAVAAAAP